MTGQRRVGGTDQGETVSGEGCRGGVQVNGGIVDRGAVGVWGGEMVGPKLSTHVIVADDKVR